MSVDSGIREYQEGRDLEAVKRIWYEVGWIENAEQAEFLADVLAVGHCLTATVDGAAECAVHITPGSIWLGARELPMSAVTAVTTSRVGRRMGFAQRLTACQLARGAEGGAVVSALGMFDQGFYDRVGFGSGSYQHFFAFDPATLRVEAPHRPPARLTKEHWREVHQALCARLKNHGACVLDPPEVIKADLGWSTNGFGLGYFDAGELTHFLWLRDEEDSEHGPYEVQYLAYRDRDQLLELFALLRSLGDQVSTILMEEPAHVQLQDLLSQPLRHRRNTRGSKHANQHLSASQWQLRVLNVPACVARYHALGHVEFNADIHDPVQALLDTSPQQSAWRGAGGSYRVNLGPSSEAVPGSDPALPTLRASIGAFSRLLFGIASASNLAATDALSGPPELLAALDEAVTVRACVTGWEF